MLTQDHPGTVEQSPRADAPATAFAILVVEDNEASRDVLCRRLARRGYRVTPARDGAEALGLVRERSFDLVLLDVMMPGMNGLDVLRCLRQTHGPKELPVIMATAKDQTEDIVCALELGASDYVTKPLDFAVVLARVQTHLSLKRSVQEVIELERQLSERNAELELSNSRMRHDLEAAARIQAAFLPRAQPAVPGMRFAWTYRPCEALAGDFLNVFALSPFQVAMYVLDVSGHGVRAALLSVMLGRLLSPDPNGDSILFRGPEDPREDRVMPPAEVTRRLERKFPWDPATEQFFTIVYGVLDSRTREFRYASAGHPGLIHMRPSAPPALYNVPGLPIGLGGEQEEQTLLLNPGERLYLYSDGLTDVMNPDGKLLGSERLIHLLDRARTAPLEKSLSLLEEDLDQWSGGAPLRDDVSLLAVEAE